MNELLQELKEEGFVSLSSEAESIQAYFGEGQVDLVMPNESGEAETVCLFPEDQVGLYHKLKAHLEAQGLI